MRADSGFYAHALVTVCREMDARFSITIRLIKACAISSRPYPRRTGRRSFSASSPAVSADLATRMWWSTSRTNERCSATASLVGRTCRHRPHLQQDLRAVAFGCLVLHFPDVVLLFFDQGCLLVDLPMVFPLSFAVVLVQFPHKAPAEEVQPLPHCSQFR